MSNLKEDDDQITNLSIWLDMVRWTAATAVVMTHINNRLFLKIYLVPVHDRSLEHYIIAFACGFGRPAVIVFFVVSGFLVGGSSASKYKRDGVFDTRKYVIARLARLWTVLVPSMAVAALLVMVARALVPEISLSAGEEGQADIGVTTAVCNIMFLQMVACVQFAGNGALWSLFHEFWYYVTWPFVMVAIWGNKSVSERALLLAAPFVFLGVLGVLQIDAPNVALYFVLWLIGAFAATTRWSTSLLTPKKAVFAFLTSLLLWRLVIPTGRIEAFFSVTTIGDFAIGLIFALVLVAMRHGERAVNLPFPNFQRAMASFSFSLYCLHTPILNLLISILVASGLIGVRVVPSGVPSLLIASSCLLLVILLAWWFSLVTERYTLQIRKLFMSASYWCFGRPKAGTSG